MARVPKKDEEPEVTPVAPVVEPDVFGEAAEGTSLTDRQRTKLEKRDAAVPAEVVEGSNDCSNHPGVSSAATVTGDGAHETQKFCEECITRYEIVREG